MRWNCAAGSWALSRQPRSPPTWPSGERRLTFVVVGAGPTGVELAGQIVELAERTLAGAFRTIEPTDRRVILLDAAPAVLPPMGEKLGSMARRRLEKMGVEIQLNAMVTAVDYQGITVKDSDGSQRRIECACKVWAAGVAASPLGKMLAEQSDGTEIDRAGRVVVEPDLTVKGHPYVFVVGDLMAVPGVPGMAQGAIQGATYATKCIKRSLKGHDDPANRTPFSYFDKGSMATISRHNAVAQVGKLEFGGYLAWLAWLLLHLRYLVGHQNRITTVLAWRIIVFGPRPWADGDHQPDDLRPAGDEPAAGAGAGRAGSGRGSRTRRARSGRVVQPAVEELSILIV